MTIVKPRYEGNTHSLEEIAETYQVPIAKARFYSHLITAWRDGQEDALQMFGDKTRPYDMALLGLTYLISVLGYATSTIEVEVKFGSLVSRIPSNADPIMVLNELRYLYPELERNRNGNSSDRGTRAVPARSNTKGNRIR